MQFKQKHILIPTLLVIAIISVYLIYIFVLPKTPSILSDVFQNQKKIYLTEIEIKNEDIDNNENDIDNEVIEVIDNQITYANSPAYKGAKYFIKYYEINSTLLYLAYPITIDSSNPPDIVLFLHGNNTTVTKDLKSQNMKDMKKYSDTFINSNYAFAAIQIPNELWDSSNIVENIDLARKKIIKSYPTSDTFNIIAFSKGGIPAFNYAFRYSNNLDSMALLAPARREYSSNQLKLIHNIPIKIWHGINDVNVGISISDTLYSQYRGLGYKNMELVRLPNTDHFAIDTEYIKEILKYFKENE